MVLDPGSYAFEAEARDASCEIIAQACITDVLPLEDNTLTLRLDDVAGGPACPAAMCRAGICSGDIPPDTGPADTGARDSGPPDTGMTCGSDGECPGGRCRNMRCCNGCWDGTTCHTGNAEALCGAGGESCADCRAVESCIAGVCASGPVATVNASVRTSFFRGGESVWSAGGERHGAARDDRIGDAERVRADGHDPDLRRHRGRAARLVRDRSRGGALLLGKQRRRRARARHHGQRADGDGPGSGGRSRLAPRRRGRPLLLRHPERWPSPVLGRQRAGTARRLRRRARQPDRDLARRDLERGLPRDRARLRDSVGRLALVLGQPGVGSARTRRVADGGPRPAWARRPTGSR